MLRNQMAVHAMSSIVGILIGLFIAVVLLGGGSRILVIPAVICALILPFIINRVADLHEEEDEE